MGSMAAGAGGVKRQGQQLGRSAEDFAHRHEAGLKRVGRAGVACEGLVYLLVGWLALQIALRSGGGSADTSGALATIAGNPFGKVLLVGLVLGFLAMVAWQAVVVVTGEKTSRRIAAAVKAVISLGLAVSCLRLLTGGAASSSGQSQQSATQRLLEAPGGPILVVILGLAVIGFGVYTIVQGVKKKFEEKVEGSLGSGLTALGVAGHVARGAAFLVVGALIIVSSQGDTAKSRGLDSAFREIAAQPFGTILLIVVAAGVACFGLFQLLTARRRARA
ncbi:DUF1206 domain-containing protein [Kineococcus gynurae]|uniref:DUF1206 domain-containing protein n=1 Tax=Kineococcus gynurae TaxID=452979 RepID=A0ABV5LQ44_9ACTN